MDNSSLIQQIRGHLTSGGKSAYTEPLLASARKAIEEQTSTAEQQAQLVSLAKELDALLHLPPKLNFPGASATLL
jgi:hypothetical protein